MPIPKPKAGESQREYVQRCMGDSSMSEYDQDQRLAICYNEFRTNLEKVNLESYSDYPQEASENAKTALRWVEKNGWGECGEATGKARANQLANGEPISEDTISRMASFERHRQHSNRELGDGCGRLMWLAWGGDAGIEWAQRKLEQIKREKDERG
jgi:hypothetical protein